MTEHLTPQQIEEYRTRSLSPLRRLEVSDHLATCATCRQQVSAPDQVSRLRRQFEHSLSTDLRSARTEMPIHLSYEELSAYVDRKADASLRELIEGHLAFCPSCTTELEELAAFQTVLSTYPAERLEPKSSPASPRIAQRLPGRVAAWVEQLIQTGLTTPIQAMQGVLERIDRAVALAAPVPVRSVQSPEGLCPAFTAIRSQSPLLTWTPSDRADAYVVTVYQAQTRERFRPIWSETVGKQPQFRLPEQAGLVPGSIYVWQVFAVRGEQQYPSAPVGFSTVSEKTQSAIATMEQEVGESPLALAGLYEAYGLYEEALQQIEKLHGIDPTSEVEIMLDRLKEKLHLPLKTQSS